MNVYGFAGGDPVNFSDPFGLCPPCYPGMFGMQPAPAGNPWKGLTVLASVTAAAMALPAIAGWALGAEVADPTPAGLAVGKSTQRLIGMLEEAGAGMDARIDAASKWLPAGQKALMTSLEGGAQLMSGGAGENHQDHHA